MPILRNEQEIISVLRAKTRDAIESATKEILDIFKESYLKEFAYIDTPEKYERTYEFLNAWEFSEIMERTKSIVTELAFHPENMHTFNPAKFIHGSKYSNPEDIRDILPEILEGKQSRLWISVSRPVKFWQRFISDMVKGGELEKILSRHFKQNGFFVYH